MRHGLTGYVKHKCRCEVCRAAKARSERQGVDPRPCRHCGKSFTPIASNVKRGNGMYCSSRCAGAWRASNNAGNSRRTIYLPGHPLASKNGRLFFHRYLLFEKLGAGVHPCYWCGDPVEWKVRDGRGVGVGDLVVDHLDGDPQNNDPSNLVAACNQCNTIRALVTGWERQKGKPISSVLPIA